MKKMTYSLKEHVHVELRIGRKVIERSYPAGLATAENDDDRLALAHLVATGHAEPAQPDRKAKEVLP